MTLKQFFTKHPNLDYDQVNGVYIVFDAITADQIEGMSSGKFRLSPTMIDEDTYFLTADCLTEIDGIYAEIIANLPSDDMTMVSGQDWIPYQTIIESRNTEEI